VPFLPLEQQLQRRPVFDHPSFVLLPGKEKRASLLLLLLLLLLPKSRRERHSRSGNSSRSNSSGRRSNSSGRFFLEEAPDEITHFLGLLHRQAKPHHLTGL
jgi:hypothetical protein